MLMVVTLRSTFGFAMHRSPICNIVKAEGDSFSPSCYGRDREGVAPRTRFFVTGSRRRFPACRGRCESPSPA